MSQELKQEDIRGALKQGFVSALAATDLPDEEIKKRASEYEKQLDKREAHSEAIRAAVLPTAQA